MLKRILGKLLQRNGKKVSSINPETTLLLGSTGVLGSCFEGDYLKPTKRELDVLDIIKLKRYILDNNVKSIINCVALVGTGVCRESPGLAYSLNVTATENIVAMCRRFNLRLIHFSTIYSGDDNLYAWTKLMSERTVLSYLTDCAVIRLPWLFGSHNTFVDVILDYIEQDSILRLYPDSGYTAYTKDIVKYVEDNFHSITGCIDLYSEGSLTKGDLTKEVSKLIGKDCKTELLERPIPMVVRLNPQKHLLRDWREALKEYFDVSGTVQPAT